MMLMLVLMLMLMLMMLIVPFVPLRLFSGSYIAANEHFSFPGSLRYTFVVFPKRPDRLTLIFTSNFHFIFCVFGVFRNIPVKI